MIKRGCGYRAEDSLYVCLNESPFGKPIEYFLIDPVVLWKGANPLRGFMIVEDGEEINHLVMGYGKTYYPFIPDVVEEARLLGVSKKVSRDFDPSTLTFGKSKLLFMHPRGIPQFLYRLPMHICPKNNKKPHNCIGNLWQLSTASSIKPYHQVTEIEFMKFRGAKISTPSTTYEVYFPLEHPIWKQQRYEPALFLQFPSFHFEYVNKEKKCPNDIKRTIKKAGFKLEVLPE